MDANTKKAFSQTISENMYHDTVGKTMCEPFCGFSFVLKFHFVLSYIHVLSLQSQLKSFMDSTFEKIQNTERALNVLKKFER